MSSSTVRIGIVGCGRLAELGYVPAIAATAGAAIVAVADPDPARRSLVAGLAYDGAAVATADDARALVGDTAVDVVIVASPVDAHVADATASTAAGCTTLVEKPPAPTAAGAARLAALRPVPWVGFNRRFDLGARRVRAAMPASGEVRLGLRIAYRRESWRAHSVDDDALLDLGPHVVDLAAWVTGRPVRAVGGAELRHDRARATLTFDRGRADIEVACDRPYREGIELRDGCGELLARHALGGLVATVRSRVRPGPHPLVASLAAQVAAIVRVARCQGPGALADARDGVRAMAVIDAIRTSAAQRGATVPVAPNDEPPPCS